jgi:hypothetical protein
VESIVDEADAEALGVGAEEPIVGVIRRSGDGHDAELPRI